MRTLSKAPSKPPIPMPESAEKRRVGVAIAPLGELYTYLVESNSSLHGHHVKVPLGKRKAAGFIYQDPAPEADFECKEIEAVEIGQKSFENEHREFFEWVAKYYCVPISQVLETAVPRQTSERFKSHIVLRDRDLLSPRAGKTQKAILEFLEEQGGAADFDLIKRRYPSASPSLKRMEELGVIERLQLALHDGYKLRTEIPEWASKEVTLSSEQATLCEGINQDIANSHFQTHLLHGETGSGKTEVYIESARYALEQDKTVLVIVPEIALTPQLVDRFRGRLGDNIAVLHSGVKPRERWEGWKALLEGRCKIALGARSAVFAPMSSIGLVIVDEEHDSSFKQNDGIRYSARDLAIVRAKLSKCPVVLGSATPSLESFYHARSRKYLYHQLSAFHPSKNKIKVIDLSITKRKAYASQNLTISFVEELRKSVDSGKQAFILYNRRGFASYLQCDSCEEVIECPNCSVTLTLHRGKNLLLCHYCGLELPIPNNCPSCLGGNELVERGAGTERIFEELLELFPSTSISRLDRDVASNLEKYSQVLRQLRSGETQVLVGTQMIAKGHDIPDVEFVGVVDADVGIHFPDFRSAERSFQLLTQVAGRAGRSENAGTVVFQTRLAKHPSIAYSVTGDFDRFAHSQMLERKELRYPPFTKLLRVVAQSVHQPDSLAVLRAMAERLEKLRPELEILGPSACPIEKIKTRYRAHMLLRSNDTKLIMQALQRLRALKVSSRCRLSFDLDPVDML